MIGQYNRRIGPRFDRGNWSGPRFFRGYRRHAFLYARPGYRRLGGQRSQPTAEQRALGNSAAEVARLFAIVARSAHGDAEKQGQLGAFLERSRDELSEFIHGSSQHPQQANPENASKVEQG